MAKNPQFKNFEIAESSILNEIDKIRHNLNDMDDKVVSGKKEVDTELLAKMRVTARILQMVAGFLR